MRVTHTIGTAVLSGTLLLTGCATTTTSPAAHQPSAGDEVTDTTTASPATWAWAGALAPASQATVAAPVTAAVAAPAVAPPTPASPTPVVIPRPVVASGQVLALVKQHFPPAQVSNAMAVAQCESGQRSIVGETNSDNTTDYGIFQLNDGGTLQSALRRIGVPFTSTADAAAKAMDPTINISAAAAIYEDRGWAPWVCAYKQQIVDRLYTNDKGPLYGRYTISGTAIDMTVKKPVKKPAPPTGAKKPTHPPKPAPTPPPTPTLTPTPTPTPPPTPAPTP